MEETEGGWKLKRVRQCDKCPWRKDVDARDIPRGYSIERHRALARTIAVPGSLEDVPAVMSCHEHDSDDGVICVGWLVNQIGEGNNIPLRLRMMSCLNADGITAIGDQHETFEDTIPAEE